MKHILNKKRVGLVLGLVMILGVTGCARDERLKEQQGYKETGDKAMAEEKYPEAIKAYNKAMELSMGEIGKNEVEISLNKAQVYLLQGEEEKALELYENLLKFKKKNPDIYMERGKYYIQKGEKDLAIKDFEQVATLDRTNYQRFLDIYEALESHGYKSNGVVYLENALEIHPKTKGDYAKRGYVEILMENYDNAMQELDIALEDDDNLEARFYMGIVSVEKGNMDQAKIHFQAGMKDKELKHKEAKIKERIDMSIDENIDKAKQYMEIYQLLFPEDVTGIQEIQNKIQEKETPEGEPTEGEATESETIESEETNEA